jgi:two-component system sensor histidine kinase TctE
MSNLIENAILYTQAGRLVKIQIKNKEKVRLSVEDTGSGIPKEERERVFERFYRILGTRIDGNGLGLAIVKEIAIAHNARLSIESVDPSGTCFVVEFEPLHVLNSIKRPTMKIVI